MAFDLGQARNEMRYLTLVLVFGLETLRTESFPKREYSFRFRDNPIPEFPSVSCCVGWKCVGGWERVTQAPMEHLVWPQHSSL